MLKTRVKNALLPKGRNPRRLPLGIGKGIRLRIDLHDGMVRTYLGLYEIELNKHIRRLARPGVPAFDIGGREGYDAMVIAKLTAAPVLSVDFEPEFCDEIRRNADLNPALADKITVAQAFVDDTGVTLDELAAEHFMPGFVKMDIEGGEAAALRGATQVLAHHPGLLVEVHAVDIEAEVLDILRGAGYDDVQIVNPRAWLADHRPIDHNRWVIAS